MANWNKDIKVQVRLPYITQICTLGYLIAELNVTSEDIWFSGISRESRVWKAEVYYGDTRLLIVGKAFHRQGVDHPTTYKVKAFGTHDGINASEEGFRTKVLSHN